MINQQTIITIENNNSEKNKKEIMCNHRTERKCEVPAMAFVCAATTSMVDPASLCSRVSPTHAMTFSP